MLVKRDDISGEYKYTMEELIGKVKYISMHRNRLEDMGSNVIIIIIEHEIDCYLGYFNKILFSWR